MTERSLSSVNWVVLDTETTGLEPEEHTLVELSAARMYAGGNIETVIDTLINPLRDILPEAKAEHHIQERDLKDKPLREQALETFLGRLDPDTDILAAHNAAFDRSFLPELDGFTWVDTLRLARHLYPDAPRHKNQVLRYYLGLEIETGNPHRAMPDVEVTVELLSQMLSQVQLQGVDTLEALLAYIDHPVRVKRMTFGKDWGTPLEELDPEYVDWLLTKANNMDDDLRWSLLNRFELAAGQPPTTSLPDTDRSSLF